jgi:hypothetical protein
MITIKLSKLKWIMNLIKYNIDRNNMFWECSRRFTNFYFLMSVTTNITARSTLKHAHKRSGITLVIRVEPISSLILEYRTFFLDELFLDTMCNEDSLFLGFSRPFLHKLVRVRGPRSRNVYDLFSKSLEHYFFFFVFITFF